MAFFWFRFFFLAPAGKLFSVHEIRTLITEFDASPPPLARPAGPVATTERRNPTGGRHLRSEPGTLVPEAGEGKMKR